MPLHEWDSYRKRLRQGIIIVWLAVFQKIIENSIE